MALAGACSALIVLVVLVLLMLSHGEDSASFKSFIVVYTLCIWGPAFPLWRTGSRRPRGLAVGLVVGWSLVVAVLSVGALTGGEERGAEADTFEACSIWNEHIEAGFLTGDRQRILKEIGIFTNGRDPSIADENLLVANQWIRVADTAGLSVGRAANDGWICRQETSR